jgi:ABC-2 type transport system permease protein
VVSVPALRWQSQIPVRLLADGFKKLQVVPLLVITPLTFLGGTSYSVSILPPFWQTVTLFNPLVYLISGFRWSLYEVSDVSVGVSLGMSSRYAIKARRARPPCR